MAEGRRIIILTVKLLLQQDFGKVQWINNMCIIPVRRIVGIKKMYTI